LVDLDLGRVPDIRRRSWELVVQAEVVQGEEEAIEEVLRDKVKTWRALPRRNSIKIVNFVLSLSPTAHIHLTLQ
jgi:hypothetical protein